MKPMSSTEAKETPSVTTNSVTTVSVTAQSSQSQGSLVHSQHNDYLVSEHEDNDTDIRLVGEEEEDEEADDDDVQRDESGPCSDSVVGTSSVSTNTAATTTVLGGQLVDHNGNDVPAEIPPEPDHHSGQEEEEEEDHHDDDEQNDSDYEYDYDDDDDGHYSGFLLSTNANIHTSTTTNNNTIAPTTASATNTLVVPNTTHPIIEEEESQSHSHNQHNISNNNSNTNTSLTSHNSSVASIPTTTTTTNTNTTTQDYPHKPNPRKSTWREPSQEAVSMSLRAEREKTGGKRRLASDLYKIMTNDTEESGFLIEPQSEECMNKWRIKLFKFDQDSNLFKDMVVLGLDHVELEMSFPDQYPFEPPFVRVVRPRFKRQTGFVMNGALCMELLTSEGWNPVNDIESVIVSIRSLLVVGDGRLEAAVNLPERTRNARLEAYMADHKNGNVQNSISRSSSQVEEEEGKDSSTGGAGGEKKGIASSNVRNDVGQYSIMEAEAAYSHLSNYHKKKGWSGWWAEKG